MAFEVKQTRDVCVEKLTETEGKALEITANLKSIGQVEAIMQGYIDKALGSKYGVDKMEMLLRLSDSVNGRARDDLVAIGTTRDFLGRGGFWDGGGSD